MPSIPKVQYATDMRADLVDASRVEHVYLAADEFSIDRSVQGARTGPSVTIASRLRRCQTEVAFLEGHRLAIRTLRAHSFDRQYVVDLRFVDERPLVRRHFAGRCWLAVLGCLLLALAVHALSTLPALQSVNEFALPIEVGLTALALAIGALAAYRTHESVVLRSAHGGIALVELIGDLGCSRAFAAFGAEIARRVTDARSRVTQSRQQFLRDELREHRRLFEDGVLSRDTYEAGKQRILQAHS